MARKTDLVDIGLKNYINALSQLGFHVTGDGRLKHLTVPTLVFEPGDVELSSLIKFVYNQAVSDVLDRAETLMMK